jgi:hemolysin III
VAAATAEDEFANSATHGVALLAAIAAAPFLIVNAARAGGASDIVGAAIFAASLIVLYLTSTLYHGARRRSIKERLRRLDHAAIYVLIAGTYTPFTLGVLRGGWGWALFGVIWGAAALGVATKVSWGVRRPLLSTALYVAMGWLVLVAIPPLVTRMPPAGVLWLVLGGLAYSGGVFFFLRSTRYAHAIWHLFVMAGSACHVIAVLGYAA